jgi:hypothetical protein
VRPYLKNNQCKNAGRVAEVAEYLPSKQAALNTTRRKGTGDTEERGEREGRKEGEKRERRKRKTKKERNSVLRN